MTKALDNWNEIIAANPPATNTEKRIDNAVIGSLNAFYNANPGLYEGTNIKCPLNDKHKLANSLLIYLPSYEVNTEKYNYIKKLIDAVEKPDKSIMKACNKKPQTQEDLDAEAGEIEFTEEESKEAMK